MIDRLFVSYPKSGRTWFRYIFHLAKIDIAFTHASSDKTVRVEQFADEEVDRNRIVAKGFGVFLHRNPIDTAISMYFHRKYRSHRPYTWRWLRHSLSGNLPPVALSAFLEDPIHGVERICRFNRTWLDALAGSRDFLVVQYEDMVSDAPTILRSVLSHYGLGDGQDVDALLEQSAFSRMRAASEKTRLSWLRAKGSNPDGQKVRKGVVGGYRDYLSETEWRDYEALCERYGLGAARAC